MSRFVSLPSGTIINLDLITFVNVRGPDRKLGRSQPVISISFATVGSIGKQDQFMCLDVESKDTAAFLAGLSSLANADVSALVRALEKARPR